MRFINGEQRYLCFAQQAPKFLGIGAFGRDIEQIQRAATKPLHRLGAVVVGASQRRRPDAHCIGGAHLVVHQRDQRRDDNAGAVHHQRRQLVTKRLARAGRHNGERIFAREHACHHGFLHATEFRESKNAVQDVGGVNYVRSRSHCSWP